MKYEIYKSWQSKIMHHHCGGLIVCTGRVEMRNHVGKDVRSHGQVLHTVLQRPADPFSAMPWSRWMCCMLKYWHNARCVQKVLIFIFLKNLPYVIPNLMFRASHVVLCLFLKL